MSKGIATATGVALGVAYGAATGQLAWCLALGTAAGALLDVVAHFARRWRRQRAEADLQP